MNKKTEPERFGFFPKSILLLLSLMAIPLWVAGQAQETPYLNLDFEDAISNNKVKYWMVPDSGCEVRLDRQEKYSGEASLNMEGDGTGDKFGVATGTFPVAAAAGKRATFSGYLKTEGVTNGYAGLWWRVDGEKGGKVLAFDNMSGRGATGTTPWKKYQIVLDVPATGAVNINFGVLLAGAGKAWFDHLQIALNGEPYPQSKPVPLVPTETDLAWIRAHAIPISSADPNADPAELLPLKKRIGNSRIVALGEGTHGTSEFFNMKHRIVKFLATEMGFTVFAIEANMPEARLLNQYVLTGAGDPRNGLAALHFWTWNTREVLDMIEWMREFNQSGRGRIEFCGFDMQFPTAAMAAVSDFVKRADPRFVKSLERNFREIERIFQKFSAPNGFSEKDFSRWYNEAREVHGHLAARRHMYIKTIAVAEVDQAIQDANVVQQGAELMMDGKRTRDQSMAENLNWILAHHPPGTRVVTWAHNGHVCRQVDGFTPMGEFLHRQYGSDMVVIGFAFHEGEYTAVGNKGINTYGTSASEPGSVEWFLKCSGIPNLLLDLRQAAAGEAGSQWLRRPMDFRSIGAVAEDYAFSREEIARRFDILCFFSKGSPTDCFRRKK